MFSWSINYGFAYNLPSNATYYQNPPSDSISNFPFLDLFPFRDLSHDDPTTTTTTEAPSSTDAPTDPPPAPDSHEMITFINATANSTSNRRQDWNYHRRYPTYSNTYDSPTNYYERPNYQFSSNELGSVYTSNDRVTSNIYPVYYPSKIETKPMMQRRYRRDVYMSIEAVLTR